MHILSQLIKWNLGSPHSDAEFNLSFQFLTWKSVTAIYLFIYYYYYYYFSVLWICYCLNFVAWSELQSYHAAFYWSSITLCLFNLGTVNLIFDAQCSDLLFIRIDEAVLIKASNVNSCAGNFWVVLIFRCCFSGWKMRVIASAKSCHT